VGEKLHHNFEDSRKRGYDRLREGGVPKDTAKKIANDAARQTHEAADRQHTDRKDPNRRR